MDLPSLQFQLEVIQQECIAFIQQTKETMDKMVDNLDNHMDIAERAVQSWDVHKVEKETHELCVALQQTRDKLCCVDIMAEKVSRLKQMVITRLNSL